MFSLLSSVRDIGSSHVKTVAFAGRFGFYMRKVFPRLCASFYVGYLRRRYGRDNRECIQAVMSSPVKRPLFIHMETINRCNGTCSFCPVNKHHDIRPLKKMDEALFRKIIDELHDISYSGILMLSGNCEPFLDTRLPEFITYASERLKNAQLMLFTNGTLLTDEMLGKIAGKLDILYVNNYHVKYELLPHSQRIYNYVKNHEEDFGDMRVVIEYRYANEVLTNKNGQAPNNTNTRIIYTDLCPSPYIESIIFPDGVVGLCCNDNYEATHFGNVAEQTFLTIFNGAKLEEVRKKMQTGRNGFDFCKYCDFSSKGGRRSKWMKTGRE